MKTTFENFLIYNVMENTSNDEYITKLNRETAIKMLKEHCTANNKITTTFYRGDKSLTDECYLINSKKTVNRLANGFNYIMTEFVSSDLWKTSNYPLKRNSVDMTTDKSLADELKANHFNVKVNEANKSFTISLKRKANRADGSSNGAPKVYNADATIMEDVSKIGNGSTGNVIVYQMYYKTAGFV